MERELIIASEGMILTNGETYGRKIYLAEGVDKSVFYEITEEEYEKILEEEMAKEAEIQSGENYDTN